MKKILPISLFAALAVIALLAVRLSQQASFPHDVPLAEDHLPAALSQKVEHCHLKGMMAARKHEGDAVVDIVCYEK